jgi:hypothetical protein
MGSSLGASLAATLLGLMLPAFWLIKREMKETASAVSSAGGPGITLAPYFAI